MTKRTKRINDAIKRQKEYYGECPFTGSRLTDGAHIIPRDVMRELASYDENILPMVREVHHEFDKIGDRDFTARFSFCVDNAMPEFRGAVRSQIERLKIKLKELKSV